jgi:hypothetical protein
VNVRQLLVTAGVVPSSQILVTLMKDALSSSDTSVITRATRRNIQEDAILHVSLMSVSLIALSIVPHIRVRSYRSILLFTLLSLN